MANEKHLAILLKGVNTWNQWRNENPEVKPDFSCSNLKGTELNDANFINANFEKTILIHSNLNGVNFYNANLESADLSNANLRNSNVSETNLKSVNLREAKLNGSTFFNSNLIDSNLYHANLHNANLYNVNLNNANLYRAKLRFVNLQNSSCNNSNFNSANLYGANLIGANFNTACLERANLSDVDLTLAKLEHANLSYAKLENANLTRARFTNAKLENVNLQKVQALGTNFNNSIFTGSCIEDWNINNQTSLNDVQCDYIYLKSFLKDRRPHDPNKIFAPGEFTQLFQKALETVDLIFSDGIDWRAFQISFNKLQIECDSDELSINSFENKDNCALVIRVNVPDGADKAEIEKYLQKQYQLEAKVESQARELANLYEITKLLAGRTINVTNQASGNTYKTEKAGIVHHEGDISDNAKIAAVYNEVTQQDFTQAAASIQQLIEQVQKTNGVTLEAAQQQAAKDLATKATSDPTLKDKLIQLGKFISENSAKTIVSEGVKGVIKLFLLMV